MGMGASARTIPPCQPACNQPGHTPVTHPSHTQDPTDAHFQHIRHPVDAHESHMNYSPATQRRHTRHSIPTQRSHTTVWVIVEPWMSCRCVFDV